MKNQFYEVKIPTKNEIQEYIKSFFIDGQRNYILDLILYMSNNVPMVLIKETPDSDYSILLLDNTIIAMEDYIRSKSDLIINRDSFELKEHFTYELLHTFKHRIIEYENDMKLYNENNFDQWYENIKKTKIPNVYVTNSQLPDSYYVESLYCCLFNYDRLFSIPGNYQCKSITIPYDDIIDLSYLSQEAFSDLVDLIKEKTIREIIKIKEGLTLTPLNIPNLNTINLIPTDRKYTKNDLKYLNQRKIKELCYYLKSGYDINDIYNTGLYGKTLIYNNTRKLLKMGVFTRDEINIKFPENNTVFVDTFYKDLMYRKWRGMLDRCYNEENISYPNYGGRGISVCNEWKDPDFGFENYYRDITENIGHWPGNGYSIDRIKNNGNYTLGNVRWATIEEQNNNRSFKRNKR